MTRDALYHVSKSQDLDKHGAARQESRRGRENRVVACLYGVQLDAAEDPVASHAPVANKHYAHFIGA